MHNTNTQHDLVLISQILDVHNSELLASIGEIVFKRYISDDELIRLADNLNIPQLVQDLSFFATATREQGLAQQLSLREQYRGIGPERQVMPILLPDERISETHDKHFKPTSQKTPNRHALVLTPSSLATGVVWQYNNEERKGWLVPVSDTINFDKEHVEEVKIAFRQDSLEAPPKDRFTVVSFHYKKPITNYVNQVFCGVVAWYNNRSGTINSRLGKVTIDNREIKQTDLVENQVVCFTVRYDVNRRRYAARTCRLMHQLTDLQDISEEVATLNFLLFDNPKFVGLPLAELSASAESVDELIRYRLWLVFQPATPPDGQKDSILQWEGLTKIIACSIDEKQEVASVYHLIVTLFKTLRQRVPHWLSDEVYDTKLAELCFWEPLLVLDKVSKVRFVDYLLETERVVRQVWAEVTPPTWVNEKLQTALQVWSANLILDSDTEKQEAIRRVEAATAFLRIDAAPFEALIRYTPSYQLTLWVKSPSNVAFPLPNKSDDLARLLEQVPDEKLAEALANVSTDKLTATYQYVEKLVVRSMLVDTVYKRQVDAFAALTFDLEVDNQLNVREGYFLTTETSSHYKTDEKKEITEFLRLFQLTVEQSWFTVGHNIRTFDIPVLVRLGIDFKQLHIWDTIEVEALLSPLQRSFALVTTHSAQQDTELAQALFHNQLHRIVYDWPLYASIVWPLIPPSVSRWAEEFHTKYGTVLLPPDPAAQIRFFHQQSITLPVDIETLPRDAPTLLVAPRFVWPQFVGVPDIQYWMPSDENDTGRDPYMCRFDSDKVETTIRQARIRQLILAYINGCRQNKVACTIANMPVWTRLQVETELADLDSVCTTSNELPVEPEPGACYLTDEWGFATFDQVGKTDWNICFIESQLSAVTFKQRLGRIRLHDQNEIFSQSGLWTRMVGGNRFAPISREWVSESTGLAPLPAQLTNFWLEKRNAAEFIIWGNIVRPDVCQQLWIEGYDEEPALPKKKGKVGCALTLVYTQEQTGLFYRLNPETLYRDVYWTGQFYLLQQLSVQLPIIWLIQRDDERLPLRAMVESMGFYCPPVERSLSRQLEMLYQSTQKRRVFVATTAMLPLIAQIYHWGPLTFVIDSLPLTELSVMIPNPASQNDKADTNDQALTDDDDDKEEESTDSRPSLVKRPNLDVSFELAAPILQYYRQLLCRSHSDHQLILTDPRIMDQVNLNKRWDANKHTASLWERDTEYEALYGQTAQYFPSPKQTTIHLTDLSVIQKTIESVFLGQSESGEWLTLRENQQPFFDAIIQPTDDLIVSLPTGGGKSILFQGPALYRGSLSNRLTIVITPLRALMEDQVTKLEELGFFGCVEYINQQSDNVQDIYRRIAGGEIAMVYVTPERFRSRSFNRALMTRIQRDGGLEYCVFDEAHCISQWGSEFRPDYLWVASLINRLKKANGNFPALFFSATISEQIFEDLTEIFQ